MLGEPQTSRNFSVWTARGQIVVEYVLLLVVGVSVAALITSTMVSRNPESPGFLVRKWVEIINYIGSDTADDLNPENP
ncbi:MAG: hypothetical protein AB7F86_08785 [Bdellovibrionales bacterium]